MSRKSESGIGWIHSLMILVAGTAALFVSGVVLADTDIRTSVSRHHVTGGRDNPELVVETVEEYEALATEGTRETRNTRGTFAKPGGDSVTMGVSSFDFWIYDADVILFNDDDNDGYYHGIDLLFDADTIYSSAEVYAVLYLSYEGGPWEEYAITEDFTIFGASGTDEYVIVTELMSGYPTGSYDLLIELFDTWDGSFVASFGPEDTSELAYLALEDYNRDAPLPPEPRVTHSHGGGGALDGWVLAGLILLLCVSAIRKIWRRRNDALVRIDSPAPCWRQFGE